MIFFAGSLSASVKGKELASMMVAKAKRCSPATSPRYGRVAQTGQATDGLQLADRPESPSIEIDDQVFIQRMAAETDLGGDPDSADSAEK